RVGRHQDAGADRDPARVGGGERQGDEDVGAQELRVVEPRVREAELLRALDRLPGLGGGGEGDPEIHAAGSLVLGEEPREPREGETVTPHDCLLLRRTYSTPRATRPRGAGGGRFQQDPAAL